MPQPGRRQTDRRQIILSIKHSKLSKCIYMLKLLPWMWSIPRGSSSAGEYKIYRIEALERLWCVDYTLSRNLYRTQDTQRITETQFTSLEIGLVLFPLEREKNKFDSFRSSPPRVCVQRRARARVVRYTPMRIAHRRGTSARARSDRTVLGRMEQLETQGL